jgi:ATP phosphoribosyltransferase
MQDIDSSPRLRLAVPKGRMHGGVAALLEEAGLPLPAAERSYRPRLRLPGVDVKLLKPQNIVEMLQAGSRDVGFTGADWVAELDGDLVELLDTGLDPVRVVAAAPTDLLVDGRLPQRPLVVASEYARLTADWIERAGLEARFVRSYGATEVFPPEDADVIVDNTATGSTLAANGLEIVEDVLRSSTRMYASPRAMDDPERRRRIEDLALLARSVIEARSRVMLEVNVAEDRLAALLEVLPCMREPTVSPLAGGGAYAVKAAVPRDDLPRVVPLLKQRGGSDVVVTRLAQIVP